MWEGREGGRRVVLVSRNTENLNTKRERERERKVEMFQCNTQEIGTQAIKDSCTGNTYT